MHLLLLGHRVAVDTSLLPPALAGRLAHLWRPCAEPAVGTDSGAVGDGTSSPCGADHTGGAGCAPEVTVRLLPPDHPGPLGEHDLRLTDLDADPTYRVSQHLTGVAIALASGGLLLLHAAALAPCGATAPEAVPASQGARVVGVVAASGTGKTTFCTRLAAGWRYLTDETLAVDPATLAVLAYPKPLSVVPVVSDEAAHAAHPGATYPGKADHAPADLGLTPWGVGDPTPQLAALVLARRVEDGNVLEPIDLAQALMETIAQTSSLFRLDHPLRTLAQALTLAGGPWRLSFSDQAQCSEMLASLAVGPEAEAPAWQHLPGPARPRAVGEEEVPLTRLIPGTPVISDTTRLVRAPWDDAVACEGSVVLLYGRSPVALGGAGAAAWSACDAPRTLAQLHDAVVAALGEHPESHRMVADAVAALVGRGVLTVHT